MESPKRRTSSESNQLSKAEQLEIAINKFFAEINASKHIQAQVMLPDLELEAIDNQIRKLNKTDTIIHLGVIYS